jgi:sulfoxide reductase heme-binding subunit YedZ
MQSAVQKEPIQLPHLRLIRRLVRFFVHLGALLPLGVLICSFLTGNLTANPIQEASQRTGDVALVMLLLSLACSPEASILGLKEALEYRRTLGLYAFFYAALHFLIFAGLDYAFRLDLIWDALLEKRFILVGFAAGLLLMLLALSSFRWWVKRMGKNWKNLHRLVYLAAGLVVLHYLWAVKADIRMPLLAGGVLLLLILVRIPVIQRMLMRVRYRLMRGRNP